MKRILLLFSLLLSFNGKSNQLLIPMDEKQANCLKSYGIAFWVLQHDIGIDWLLNYRGGSFLLPNIPSIEEQLIVRGVTYEVIPDAKAEQIKSYISNPEINMAVVRLEKAPRVAVYTPPGKRPWDDAVTMVLTYAEIPYDQIYDSTVVSGKLANYDWLHLHHEDFTGQYGKFYSAYRSYPWYQQQVAEAEKEAANLGFQKVSQLKLSVAEAIKAFVAGGGFLFTMCSGTDSFDIALAAHLTDICAEMYDGDPMAPDCQEKLDFSNTLAFENFQLVKDPLTYEYSNIDGTKKHITVPENTDKFTLFEFSAKWDVVPSMLTQCHTTIIDGFMGQTTDFNREFIKKNVLVMGENKALGTARYIHGELGNGTWTFYAGHDPEDYKHLVGDPETDLKLHPNSPGYRLILNNILFPAAKKQKRKT
jgi:hypothetical protein